MISCILTTINYPTYAINEFAKISDLKVVVIGDKKTPSDWFAEGVTYYSYEDQIKLKFNIIKSLPSNHYSRKIIGYLIALENGADMIYDTDDDNIPLRNWGFPKMHDEYDLVKSPKGYVNIYSHFSKQRIWPRGYPLDKLNCQPDLVIEKKLCRVGIWQGLADLDPDVDAIYRLINKDQIIFESKEPIVLSEECLTPFNSQNTLFIKELFPLLYIPAYVSFRFCDILRSLVAQPILWIYGYKIGFIEATVIQLRNAHDLMKDFESEIPMYLNTNVSDIVMSVISEEKDIYSNLLESYKALLKDGIVIAEEITNLENWIKDVKKISEQKNSQLT